MMKSNRYNLSEKLKIGLKCKSARNEKGWSQKQLGNKMEITRASVNQFESGRIGYAFDTVKKFADALSKPVSYFYDFSDIAEDPHTGKPTIVAEPPPVYNSQYMSIMQQINDILEEYPEQQEQVLKYLKSYYQGGESRFTILEGIIQALAPVEAKKAIQLVCEKFILEKGK